IHALQEMNKFHTVSLDQASKTVIKNLNSFIKRSHILQADGEEAYLAWVTAMQQAMLFKEVWVLHIEDEGGVKPLSIAMKEANTDIVTLHV
ncbi:hypothetical protein WN51_13645, partial [Melipona quadrifasciata]